MPHQDAQGRWISDDGLQYWDGSAWRPMWQPAQPRGGVSALPAVLIGCGFALVVVIVLAIGGVILFSSNSFRTQLCQSWNNNPRDAQTPCPFQPSQ
ncbi:MAG TPA: hypothetical protein VFK22_08965 [Candidatus Dormibacteraeota bacterium]|nr:hypothetical protein [Candidatus Dormibacteraeota bacterium]